jgi:hypothetical protein
MWWEEFEKSLTSAFTTFNKREGRIVHSDEMKLRMLLHKVQTDFLVHIKASIGIGLARQPITLSYEQALATFTNEVNRVIVADSSAPEYGVLFKTIFA